MIAMTKTLYLNKLTITLVLNIITYTSTNYAMQLVPRNNPVGPISYYKTVLYTSKQKLEVKTNLLLPCATLSPLIENGQQTIPLPALPAYELVNIAACLQAHYDLTHAQDQEQKDRARNHLDTQTKTPHKLHTALIAANYLAHEELITWCQRKWARLKYFTTDTMKFPDELQTDTARRMIDNSGLSMNIPGWLASDQWLDPHKTITHDIGSIWTVASNSTGTQIAMGDWMGYAHIYTQADSQNPIVINAHTSELSTIAFTHDDATIITCAQDGTIKFWDIATGTLMSTILTEHLHAPFVFRINNSTNLIAYNEGENIVLCDSITGYERFLTGHTNSIKDIAFNTQGTLLASGGHDCTVVLWDILTAECIAVLTPHTKTVLCLQFSSDGSLLACGSDDRTITVHDVATQELSVTLRGHRKGIWSVIFSVDNQFLYSGSIDGTVKIWHLPSGAAIKNLVTARHGAIQSMCMQPNGTLVTVSKNGFLKYWDINKLILPIVAMQKRMTGRSTINQAHLIEEAYNAPQHEPLDCSIKRERVELFESLDPEVQIMLVKHLHVKPPKKKQKPEKSEKDASRAPSKNKSSTARQSKNYKNNLK